MTGMNRTCFETQGPDIRINLDDDSTVLTCGNTTYIAECVQAELVSEKQL